MKYATWYLVWKLYISAPQKIGAAFRPSRRASPCRQYTEMVELGAQVPHEKKRGMKRVWSAEKDVATGAKMVGMKRVASYAKVPVKPSSSGGSA